MDVIDNFAESIGTKQSRDYQRQAEEFEVVKVGIVNNKFNFTLQNTGNIPVKITRLWVKNTTDSTWPFSKFDLNAVIAPGATVTNVSQNIDLISLNTQSYFMKFVTERGNSQKMFLNTVGEPMYLQLRATPSRVPTSFTSSILLEVINTGTNQLLNLQPEIDSTTLSCAACTATLVSGPNPPILDSLDPGDFATFEYEYSFTGEDNDQIIFTGSLVNGLDEDSATVTIQVVEAAENADVSIESGGVQDDAVVDDDILVFHMEQANVPSPGYQMMSSDIDGGNNGLQISLDTAGITSFFTNNGSNIITIPAGNWNASLTLRSESLPDSLVGEGEGMIFHFEDGAGVNPANSVNDDQDRDLEPCGAQIWKQKIQATADDAEQDEGGSMDVSGSSTDHELVFDGNHQWIGLRWDGVPVEFGSVITKADIAFRVDEVNTGASPDLIIGAQDADDPGQFTTASHNVDDRWDGAIDTVTSAKVVWDNLGGWAATGDKEKTPSLISIVQELIDRPGWNDGQAMVFIISDNSGGSNENKRTAEHFDGPNQGDAAELEIHWNSPAGDPTWQAGQGPHGSAAPYFSGADCFRSQKDVSGGEQNDIDDEDDTTSLWFRTDGTVVGSKQILVLWEGDGDYPTSADAYEISLDVGGKIRFEFNTNKNSDITTCLSTGTYDDSAWHQVVAVRGDTTGGTDHNCFLYITDINGNDEEAMITQDNNYGSNDVDADKKWYIGSNEDENGNFFKGWIDDVIHWNGKALTATEADDLSKTNYGTGAHQLDIMINATDSAGNIVSGLYGQLQTPIAFQDPKDDNFNDDEYSQFNVTMTISQTVFSAGQRMNFSMNFVPSTAAWEALALDMKIDDTGFTPFSSYLQIPFPDKPFASYVTYDNDDELDVFVNNVGDDGIYFIFQGTRVNFDGAGGAYASFIRWVNGTSGDWEVHEDRDSIYIPAGQSAELIFYKRPTDHPCRNSGDNCPVANIIPPGDYRVALWLNGYTDRGEDFRRSVILGTVTVIQ